MTIGIYNAYDPKTFREPHRRVIARAACKMSPEERKRMMAMLRDSFSEAFRNTGSDDLDDTEPVPDDRV